MATTQSHDCFADSNMSLVAVTDMAALGVTATPTATPTEAATGLPATATVVAASAAVALVDREGTRCRILELG